MKMNENENDRKMKCDVDEVEERPSEVLATALD